MQRIPSIWVCILTKGLLQNGFVFRLQTHTSGHFILESPPPPGTLTLGEPSTSTKWELNPPPPPKKKNPQKTQKTTLGQWWVPPIIASTGLPRAQGQKTLPGLPNGVSYVKTMFNQRLTPVRSKTPEDLSLQ